MKVLNLCYDDYANLAYNNTMALCSVGMEAVCYKRIPHVFGYSKEGIVTGTMAMRDVAKWADVIQIFHSWDFILDPAFKDKKKVIWHTGTTYRQNHENLNHQFNRVVDMTITDQCEFMHLGAKNIHYMATAIDLDNLKPMKRPISKPYKIGHYPSNAIVKGTDKIIAMMADLEKKFPGKFTFDCSKTILPHDVNLKRIALCDIYIELFAPYQDGKEYGCYGVTAFESTALGCLTITQNAYPDVYSRTYGISAPFYFANSEDEFYNVLKEVIHCETGFFKRSREVDLNIMQNHSFGATGARMKKLLESIS